MGVIASIVMVLFLAFVVWSIIVGFIQATRELFRKE